MCFVTVVVIWTLSLWLMYEASVYRLVDFTEAIRIEGMMAARANLDLKDNPYYGKAKSVYVNGYTIGKITLTEKKINSLAPLEFPGLQR